MENIKKKNLLIVWGVLVTLAIVSLVVLQYFSFSEYNRLQAFQASQLMITETQKIIAENDEDRNNLHRYLKESYLEKAKTAAYILDTRPEIQNSTSELRKIALALGVDQIHLFDESGTVYSSTNQDYLGLTLDAGEQIRYFMPMLENKKLTMSQDITKNTVEGRRMLYAMCWNKEGTHMVQVGAHGERFPRILNRNRIDMFLDLVPDDPASDILLTDTGSDLIVASTNTALIGKRLPDIGIQINTSITGDTQEFVSGTRRAPIYCSAKAYQDYQIFICQYKNQVDKNIPITLFTFTEYLILVFIAMTFVVDYYYERFMEEKSYAMRDKLTELYSRRAYEMTLADMDSQHLKDDLCFVSMDVNGLKTVNDTKGHQAGDLLLKGAAQCMLQCFGPFGRVYRFGGDEFAAIILIKSIEIQTFKDHFDSLCRQWSQENGMTLRGSLGFALLQDHPHANIRDLESLADQEMYAEKARYYSAAGHNRRGSSHENKQV